MARFVSGDVVVVPFPFTNLASSKVRPAVVLTSFTRGDVLLCQITSRAAGHPEAISLIDKDFEPGGGLPHDSFVLPDRFVTANETCIRRAVGRLHRDKLESIRDQVCTAIRGDSKGG
jgi:mRNA interferase MazF